MGVKDLWSILTPYCERKPLFELQGKTVAVDLSCWICEAQNVSDYAIQPRMYLRNLYFRTCFLLLMDVHPVFVLEGKAPSLKYQTIANRNEVQFKGAKPKSDKIKTGKGRTRFHFVLKQCEEMLKTMGLVCVQGTGEAESLCAYLNEDGLVSGCISQDSDCFAYGAKVVFRNFSISHQGSYAASGGAVDIYDIRKANESLNFGRNKIVTLALLCGSDYNDGVYGVGKDSALKFMNQYDDHDILDRLRSWRKNDSMFSEMENKINNKNICVSCGHFGKVQSHTKSGCAECKSDKGCDFTKYRLRSWRKNDSVFTEMENKINNKNICVSCGHFGKVQSHTKTGCAECKSDKGCDFTKYRDERLEIKNEIQIRSKALVDPEFPNETLINEFLIKKDNVSQLDLKWRQPNLINFVKFTTKYLGWEEIYAFEKLLPILTRWQIKNYKLVFDKIKRNSISEIKGIIFPKHIKKARNPKGVPSYEIIWEDKQKYFENLLPDEQLEEYLETKKDGLDSLWSTIEPKYLIDAAYPNLVEEFLDKKGKKAKKPTKRQTKPQNTVEINSLTEQLLNASITEPKTKKSRSRSKKTKESEPIKTIDSYFAKTKVEQLKQQTKGELNLSFDVNASKFGDEDDEDLNLSGIIDNIVSQTPKLQEKIENLGYKIVLSEDNCFFSQNIEDIFDETVADTKDAQNRSCFFETNYDQVDLFEKTFDKNHFSDVESDLENPEKIQTCLTDPEISEKSFEGKLNDTFDENYVPLFERIKKHGRLNTVP